MLTKKKPKTHTQGIDNTKGNQMCTNRSNKNIKEELNANNGV